MAGSVGQPTHGWFSWQASFANTNWSTRVNDANQLGMGRLASSGAQNDEVSWQVWMDVGTWKFSLVHNTGAILGIYSVRLDGVEQGTIDGYAGAGASNVYSEVTGISVTTAGVKTLALRMATKNASSTQYYGLIQSIALIKTAGAHSTPSGTDTPGYYWSYLPWMGSKANLNFTARQQNSGALGGGYLQTDTGASGNYIEMDVWVDTGTYKFACIHASSSSRGIVSVLFDGVSQTTVDQYVAAGAPNTYIESSGFSVATAGVKTMRLTSTTKNASSAGYEMTFQIIALIRTGA